MSNIKNVEKKKCAVSDMAAAFLLTIFLLSFAVTFTLNFRPFYYFNITRLDIPAASGLSVEEIKANYDALISYNSIFSNKPLVFPSFPMSEGGRIHFEEVKRIFASVQGLMFVAFAGCVAVCIRKLRKRRTSFLKLGAVCSLVLPLATGALIAVNWDRFFVFFHEAFFDNDFWMFNNKTDPVINILPDAFFLQCAVMILTLQVIGSAVLYFVGRRLGRRFTPSGVVRSGFRVSDGDSGSTE
ncbi:MAG: TIGR01906 family membrane protein [Clostridiales Family XIII bacterium]|jgi:integral membrane protein (TIGR01906 family)|nr:TIGR01906 family membrane protein [Clostridiales Family XIII bacterium]